MHVVRRRKWEMPERLATPEHLFFDRRALLASLVRPGFASCPDRHWRSASAICRTRRRISTPPSTTKSSPWIGRLQRKK